MKTTPARFKQCLGFCKSNEDRAKADALANNLLQKDNISFWKDVFKMNRTDSNVLASTINGVTGDQSITNHVLQRGRRGGGGVWRWGSNLKY